MLAAMSRRTLLVCVAAVAVVAGAAALVQSPSRETGDAPAPPAERPAEETGSVRPPEFPPVRSDEERIVHWVGTLQTGADDDVAWAVTQLRTAGPAGRRAVRDAATVAIGANPALVQQALEFLAVSPDAADAEFARRTFASRDTESALRAIRLIAAVESPLSAASLGPIADAAAACGAEARVRALQAFAGSGDDAAADRAIRVLGDTPRGEMAGAVGALVGTKNANLVAWVSGCFDAESDVRVRLAASSVLVAAGDMSRVAWLRETAGTAAAGPLDTADAALGILAKARDEQALARIGATAADRLAGADARIAAIDRLAAYPLARTRAFLEAAANAEEGVDLGVTVEALDALCRGGYAAPLALVAKHVTEGPERAVHAAALVCGRLRRADLAPPLEKALARQDLDESVRALVLRALVLSGEPRSSVTVVRAIAADHGAYDAQISMAYNAGATLGDATPAMRAAIGRDIVRALAGEFGPMSGAGLVQALRSAGICCGPEAGPELAARLSHADVEVRTNAALALGHVGGKDAERDLKAAWWRWRDGATRSTVEEAMERAHFGAAGAGR
jgi:hypothetical protein